MGSVGERLKEARLDKELSLEEVEKRTKIRKDYLFALEEDRYQDLPAGAYIQGFIKNYAQVLGLKPEPLLAIFRRDYRGKISADVEFAPQEGFSWTPKMTVIGLIVFGLLFFFGYLFWQYQLLQTSPYRP